MNKKRCAWCNLNNKLYVKYHDEEWCVPKYSDKELYELLILESFQAGLSWECILNKRENFRNAYDNFDIEKVIKYDNKKIEELNLPGLDFVENDKRYYPNGDFASYILGYAKTNEREALSFGSPALSESLCNFFGAKSVFKTK